MAQGGSRCCQDCAAGSDFLALLLSGRAVHQDCVAQPLATSMVSLAFCKASSLTWQDSSAPSKVH